MDDAAVARTGNAADVAFGFEDKDFAPALRKLTRDGESYDTCADNDGINVFHSVGYSHA